jgi:hypothetical protein
LIGWDERAHRAARRSGPVEAGGSLIPETRVRAGAAPTTTRRVGTARRSGLGKQGRKAKRAVNQWWNPLKSSSRLQPGGCGPSRQRAHARGAGRAIPTAGQPGRPGGHEESLRRTRGEAVRGKAGRRPCRPIDSERGNRPVSPSPLSGGRAGPSSADGAGRGRSLRSSPRAGEPSTGRYVARNISPSMLRSELCCVWVLEREGHPTACALNAPCAEGGDFDR